MMIETKQNNNVQKYYIAINSRGDVEKIYNSAKELVAQYSYDTWGKVISISDNKGNEITSPNHIGNLNPIRYRGYYYDEEIGLYYLGAYQALVELVFQGVLRGLPTLDHAHISCDIRRSYGWILICVDIGGICNGEKT